MKALIVKSELVSLFVSLILLAMGQSVSAAEKDTLQYRFAEGDQAKYGLKFSQHVVMRGQDAGENTVTHSYVYSQNVRRVRQSGSISLDIDLLETRFKPGVDAPEFDSRKQAHLDTAKTDNNWRVFAAIVSSKATMSVKSNGEVGFFRLASVAPEFDDDRTKHFVTRSIEEIKDHAFFLTSDTSVTKEQTWRTFVPIKFVGGPLSGQTMFATTILSLVNVEEKDGDRIAKYKVASFEPLDTDMAEDSIQGAKLELKLLKLDGTLEFSLTKGQIRFYQFKAKTWLKLSVEDQLVHEHEMDEQFSLKRLENYNPLTNWDQ